MGLKRDKRGIELSMNVVIIAIILVIVLVIVVLFFTGGITNAWDRITQIFRTQSIDYSTAQLTCNTYCTNDAVNSNNKVWQKNFCGDVTFDIDTNNDGKSDLKGATCASLGVFCRSITCGA